MSRLVVRVVIALVCGSGIAFAASGTARAAGTADVSLAVTGPASVNEGEDVVYSEAVHNAGPDPTTGFVLTDDAPSSFVFDPAASSAGSCTVSGSTVTCSVREDLFVGSGFTLRLAFRTTTTGTFINSASVTAPSTDPNPQNNSASLQTVVKPPQSADLSVVLSLPSTVNDGQTFSGSMFVSNHGPDDDPGVTPTLTVPPGLSPRFSGCVAAGSGQTCSFGQHALPSNGVELAFFLTFVATGPGSQPVSASVASNLQDPNPSNNTSAVTVNVLPTADIGVALTWPGSPQQPYAGQQFDLDLSVSNAGPDPATGDVVTLSLPSGVTPDFGGCSSATSGSTCTLSFPDQSAGTTTAAPLQFTGDAAGTYSLTATVSGGAHDPNTPNNTVSMPVTIQPAADLGLTASASPNPVVSGHQVRETIVLTNNGPSSATSPSWNTSWSSDAKGGIDFESMSVAEGSCTLSGETISCEPDDLASGQQVTLTIVVQPRSKGTLTFDSSVRSSVFDPNTANNSVATSVTIS